jgi:hypothetical protein
MSGFFVAIIRLLPAPQLLLAAAVAILLLSPASAAGQSRNQKQLPQLVIDSTKHDFGEVFAGEELEHIFTVRNVGTVPLELSQTASLVGRSNGSPGPSVRRVSFSDFAPVAAFVARSPFSAATGAAPS